MHTNRRISVAAAALASACCAWTGAAARQNLAPRDAAPCVRDERLLDLLRNQPDFSARVVELRAGVESSLPDRIARQGKRTRAVIGRDPETYWVRLYEGRGSGLDLFPLDGVYASTRGELAAVPYPFLFVREDAADRRLCFASAGEASVDGHPCLVIDVASTEPNAHTYYYLATDLRNLVVRADRGDTGRRMPGFPGPGGTNGPDAYQLADVRLDGVDDFVRVPPEYRRVKHRHRPGMFIIH